MNRPRTQLLTAPSSKAPRRGIRRRKKSGVIGFPKPAIPRQEPIEAYYRTLLRASRSAILFLSPESLILGWSRAAETVSGWAADEALGRNLAELFFPVEAREAFLIALAQVIAGKKARGLEVTLTARASVPVAEDFGS